MSLGILSALAAILLMTIPQSASASANPLTFYTNKGELSGLVTFTITGTDLLVHLENTSPIDATDPSQILDGLFFHITGNPIITRVSATIGQGGTLENAAQPAGGGLGQQWAHRRGIYGYPNNTQYQGIGAAELSIFMGSDFFPGPITNTKGTVGDYDYGLVSLSDNAATPITGAKSSTMPLVAGSVDFKFSNLPRGLTEADIGPVLFQWGPNLGCPQQSWALTAVPEPCIFGVFAVGALLMMRRRGRV